MSLLEIEGLSMAFGGVHAVDGVDLTVEEGDRRGVIGPNGAGKSTLFRLITGGLRPTGGRITYAGSDVTRTPLHKRARSGIGQTFQHSSLFGSLSCRNNVLLALQRTQGVFRPGRRARQHALADDALERFDIAHLAETPASALSHGERRQLELAIAIATAPRLLLLDEPAAGLSPAETVKLDEMIATLPAHLTILLVEHNLDLVFRVARTVTVLHLGRVIASGAPDDVRASDDVQSVYLGGASTDELFVESGSTDGAA